MWLRYLLVSLVLFLVITVNLPDGMLAHLGLAPNVLLATLVAIAIAGLVAHRNLLLVTLAVLCVAGANLPTGIAQSLGIDRDILIATLIGLILMPLIAGDGRFGS